MKLTASLMTCIALSLVLVSENASAGNNRFSGKSFGRSNGRSQGNSFQHRKFSNTRNRNQQFTRKQNFNTKQNFKTHQNFHNRKLTTTNHNRFSTMQRNTSTRKFTPQQNVRKPQITKFSHRPTPQKKLKTTNPHHFTKSKIHTFSPTKMKTIPTNSHKFKTHHNTHFGHKNLHHKGHHVSHKGHFHGHHLWHHNYTRPWCPPVCRKWYPVVCTDPIVTPCVISACAPVYVNALNEPVVAAPVMSGPEVAAAAETAPAAERLELVAGQQFQLAAEGLGSEQGMVVLEINEMGLPAKIEQWDNTTLRFEAPQVGLNKVTEAKLHILNHKGQSLATLDINLSPESIAQEVAAN